MREQEVRCDTMQRRLKELAETCHALQAELGERNRELTDTRAVLQDRSLSMPPTNYLTKGRKLIMKVSSTKGRKVSMDRGYVMAMALMWCLFREAQISSLTEAGHKQHQDLEGVYKKVTGSSTKPNSLTRIIQHT